LYFQDVNAVNFYELNNTAPLYTFNDFTQHVTAMHISRDDSLIGIGLDSG